MVKSAVKSAVESAVESVAKSAVKSVVDKWSNQRSNCGQIVVKLWSNCGQIGARTAVKPAVKQWSVGWSNRGQIMAKSGPRQRPTASSAGRVAAVAKPWSNRWSKSVVRPRCTAPQARRNRRRRVRRRLAPPASSNPRSNQRPSPWPKSEVKPWSNPDQNHGQILMVRRRPTRLAWWSGTGRTSLTSTKDRGTASAMAPPKSARRSSGANPPPLPPAAAADNKIIRRGRWRERNLRPIGASMWSHNANSTATND